jgi:hypothetical protein
VRRIRTHRQSAMTTRPRLIVWNWRAAGSAPCYCLESPVGSGQRWPSGIAMLGSPLSRPQARFVSSPRSGVIARIGGGSLVCFSSLPATVASGCGVQSEAWKTPVQPCPYPHPSPPPTLCRWGNDWSATRSQARNGSPPTLCRWKQCRVMRSTDAGSEGPACVVLRL